MSSAGYSVTGKTATEKSPFAQLSCSSIASPFPLFYTNLKVLCEESTKILHGCCKLIIIGLEYSTEIKTFGLIDVMHDAFVPNAAALIWKLFYDQFFKEIVGGAI